MPRGAAVIPYDGKRGRVWRIKYADADGKQVMETLGPEAEGWTRRKAEAELRERLVRVEKRSYRRPKPITFRQYARGWLTGCEGRRQWRPSTVKMRRLQVGRLTEFFGPMRLATIRPTHVASYVSDRLGDYSPATVNGDVDVLFEILKTAKREELVDQNAAEGAERPRVPRRRWRILEPVEVARVARALEADQQARTAFLTLVVTGVRRFELQALRWHDVDLVGNILRIRDSKTEDGVRSIALPPTLADALWQWRRSTKFQGDDERAFCNQKTGGVYREERFAEAFRDALAEAGIDDYIRPFHDLRHTAITNDAAAGASPVALMTKAGHASMSTTKRYLHLAGVVFHEEAAALEQRYGLSTPLSTHLSASEPTSPDENGSDKRPEEPAHVN
jgi:integrase